ncbi:MAG TPA: sulfotransferase [Anaerolineales bacterium]|nr:sulfotransferase [Anaerolineales bacterium]
MNKQGRPKRESLSPNRIIVLGVMRSGTSLTAELIRLWGAYAGSQDHLWESNVNDPRGYGYMEYIPLQKLNNELLDHNDRVPPLEESFDQKISSRKYREQAKSLLQNMDELTQKSKASDWVWKDARLPLTLPFWTRLWGDVIYVITIRHPAEIALSLAQAAEVDKENLPYSAGFIYWQYCMLQVISYTQHNSRKIFIAYDQLINNPTEEVTRLCNFLDKNCDKSSQDSQKRINAMLPRVAKSQQHQHYQRSLAEMPQATREQRALYDFLRVKILYPDESFNIDDFALYPGWREYLESVDMLMTLQGAKDM